MAEDKAAAGVGAIGMAGVAGIIYASYGMSADDKAVVKDEMDMSLVTSAVLATVSAVFWTIHFVRLFGTRHGTWTLYAAGYPAMAAVAVASFAVGLLARVNTNETAIGLAVGAVGLAAVVSAICAHARESDQKEVKRSGGVFVLTQTVLSVAAPLVLIFVLTEGEFVAGSRAYNNNIFNVYAAIIAAIALGFLSLALFLNYFLPKRDKKSGWKQGILWLAIITDSAALALTVISAGYIYVIGDDTENKVAEDPGTALWLLYVSATIKVFHWILSHFWASAKIKTN